MFLRAALLILALTVATCVGAPSPGSDDSAKAIEKRSTTKYSCECDEGVNIDDAVKCKCSTGTGTGTLTCSTDSASQSSASDGITEYDKASTTFAACMKRDSKADLTVKPDWTLLLKDDNSTWEVPGKWKRIFCHGAVREVFVVTLSNYRDALRKCKTWDYDVVQPIKYTFNGFYCFQVGQSNKEHFDLGPSWLEYTRVKETPVDECSVSPKEDATTTIQCSRYDSSYPGAYWLTKSDGTNTRVSGHWVERPCINASAIRTFEIPEDKFNEIVQQCKSRVGSGQWDLPHAAAFTSPNILYPLSVKGKNVTGFWRYQWKANKYVSTDKCYE